MADLIYHRPSDNVADTVTPSLLTGTANANFPLTRLYDGDPATAFKTTSTGDCRVVWDYTSAQRVDCVWVPIHNALAGTVLRFEGHTANTWATPTVSATHTVQAYRQGLPQGVFIDVTAASGYSASGLRYWSLFVPNTGIVTALGEIIISSRKRTTKNLLRGVQRDQSRLQTRHARADGGFFKYDRGVTTWAVRGRVIPTSDTVYDDYVALWDDTKDGIEPFGIVLEGDHAVPEGIVVEWVGGFRQTNQSGRRSSSVNYPIEAFDFTWQMVPRGRAL